MAEAEYPRWVYPPEGGPGKVIATPDERPDGWLDGPSPDAPNTGSGEGSTPAADPPAGGLTADELAEVETLERKVQAEEADGDDAPTRKSKKK